MLEFVAQVLANPGYLAALVRIARCSAALFVAFCNVGIIRAQGGIG